MSSELSARVRRSLVDVHVRRARGGGELHTLGVVAVPGAVMAWSGVDTAGAVWDNLGSVSIRQGARGWTAEVHSLRREWALCALRVHGEFPLPVVPFRRSSTLSLGDGLLYAVADPRCGEPRLGWTELVDVYVADKESYGRAFIWTARLDPQMPREYAFAFDREGRVAGLLEPLPDTPNLAALLAGEFVGCLLERCWLDMLLQTGNVRQLVDEYKEAPDSYEAEGQCAVATALIGLRDDDGAMEALRRAIAKDPRNPWPRRALAGLLPRDRNDEAFLLLEQAREIEAQEPADEGSETDA